MLDVMSDDRRLSGQWSRVAGAADFLLDIKALVDTIQQQYVQHYSSSTTSSMSRVLKPDYFFFEML